MKVNDHTLKVMRSFGKSCFTEAHKIKVLNYFFVNGKYAPISERIMVGDNLENRDEDIIKGMLYLWSVIKTINKNSLKNSTYKIYRIRETIVDKMGEKKSSYRISVEEGDLDDLLDDLSTLFNLIQLDPTSTKLFSLMSRDYSVFKDESDEVNDVINRIDKLRDYKYLTFLIDYKMKEDGKMVNLKRTWYTFGEEKSIASENMKVAMEFGVLPFSITANTTEIIP